MGAIVWFGIRRNYSAPPPNAARLEVNVVPKQPNAPSPSPSLIVTPTAEIASGVASPMPTTAPDPSSEPTASLSPSPPLAVLVGSDLIIPVAGIRADQLIDTFDAARSEGRVHDAIDIMAPQGTPVLAAANGSIVKLFQSEKGGITIYQLSADKKVIYYYAHLQRYADGLSEGQSVRQGDVIAYVGDTGNAGPGNFHLHFSISLVADPKRYWDGTNINPYPLLHH